MGKTLGGWGSVVGKPFSIIYVGCGCACRLCQPRRAGARCAGCGSTARGAERPLWAA